MRLQLLSWRVLVSSSLVVLVPACISIRGYPEEWPDRDGTTRDLSGVYENVGASSGGAWWLPRFLRPALRRAHFDEHVSSFLTDLLVKDNDLRNKVRKVPPEDCTVEVADLGQSLQLVVRSGQQELGRHSLVMGKTGGGDEGFGGWTEWRIEDGKLLEQHDELLLTIFINTELGRRMTLQRAADGSLVAETRSFGLGLALFYPFWHGYSRTWARWKRVDPEAPSTSRETN